MSQIRIDFKNFKTPSLDKNAIKTALDRFLSDMDQDKSSFFHLPIQSKWNEEIAMVKPQLSKRVPQINTFIHLGIGGSSLGTETIVKALGVVNAPDFHFLDNIDPDYLNAVLSTCDPKSSLLFVVTKSGTTMETLAQFLYIYQWFEKSLGAEEAKKHLVFCTDPEKGDLRSLATQWAIPCFDIPRNLGGRFSALCGVGLFPGLVAGVDGAAILKGAAFYRSQFIEQVKKGETPEVLELAARLVSAYQKDNRNITVLMPYSQKLKSLSAWFTQLWAESLGKNELGITPVPAVGPTDQHSIVQLLRDGPNDKVIGFVEVAGFQNIVDLKWSGPRLSSFEQVSGITLNQLMDAEFNATREALTNVGKPNFTITLPRLNAETLGQLLFTLELLTALSGYLLEIDPFDQPGVEEGKRLTQERIRSCKKTAIV